jgi:hypothetical protein
MPFFAFFDPVYLIIVAPGIVLSIWASMKVRSAFARWSKVASPNGMSGAQVAAVMLDRAGLPGVRIEHVRGRGLSDHYDPRSKVLRLSTDVYGGRSVASVAVAAHEAGHALQDASGYGPLMLRTAAVPVASLGSKLSWVLILAGMLMGYFTSNPAYLQWTPVLLWAGVIGFSAVVAFQIVTLPVEFNASRRARERLLELGIIDRSQEQGVKAVLDAAALTYVAAAVTGLLTLFYYLMRLGLLGGRND